MVSARTVSVTLVLFTLTWAGQDAPKIVVKDVPVAPEVVAASPSENSNKIVLLPESNKDGTSLIVGAVDGKGGSRICWLKVPGNSGNKHDEDWVLVALNQLLPKGHLVTGKECLVDPGILSYVNFYPLEAARNPAHIPIELPAGLFFWFEDWVALGSPIFGMEYEDYPVRETSKGPAFVWDAKQKAYAHQTTGVAFIPKTDRHPDDNAVRQWVYHDLVDRNKAFESLMCVTEEHFKLALGALTALDAAKALDAFTTKVLATLPDRAKSCFPDGCVRNFHRETVSSLRSNYPVNGAASRIKKHGKLFIMKKSEFDKRDEGYKVHVRYLQEHFPGAVFQIASTFSCMESGLVSYDRPLDTMNYLSAQGENAVLATISGAIVRRYFVPREQRNLLHHVGDIFVGAGKDTWNPRIQGIVDDFTYEKLLKGSQLLGAVSGDKSQTLELGLSGAMAVGVHERLHVVSGSWAKADVEIPRNDKPFTGEDYRRVPAFDRCIASPKKVHHIYTSAVDLNTEYTRGSKKKDKVAQKIQALRDNGATIPKMALRAAYEGTILAACTLQNQRSQLTRKAAANFDEFLYETEEDLPRLFLTFIGTGTLQNDPAWVVTILQQLQALIYDSGLQIGLLVWDESSDVIKQLDALSEAINAGDIVSLSKSAKNAGEQLWCFDGTGNVAPSLPKGTQIILPIKKQILKVW